jgi:uncharacterized protein (DUF2141 family)
MKYSFNTHYRSFFGLFCMVLMGLSGCGAKKAEAEGRTTDVETITAEGTGAAGEKDKPDEKKSESKSEAAVDPIIGKGPKADKPLKIVITNLKNTKAPIMMGLFGPGDGFPDEKAQIKAYKFIPNGETMEVLLENLAYGDFAMAFYQDIDGSGKIDKNGLGIPTEPYAFSNNFRPSVRAPKFEQCKITFSPTTSTINVKMGR